MKRLLMAMCLIFAMVTAINAKPLTMEQVLEGTCRVASQQSNGGWHTGTGTCVSDKDEKFWLFTNGHVVDNGRAFKVYFFRNGYRSAGIDAKVEWKNFKKSTNVDFALMSVSKDKVGKYFKPRIIPFANVDAVIKRDTFFVAGTCPMGLDALVRKGRVYGTEDWRFYISEVLPGQSGSGVLINVKDAKGELQTRLGGIITWRISIPTANNKKVVLGGVIPIKVIRTVMAGQPYQPHVIPSNFMNASATEEVCWPTNTATLCSPDGRPFLDAYVLGSDGVFYLKNLDGSVNVPVGTEIECWFLRRIWQARPGIIIPRTYAPRRPLVPLRPYGQPGPCDPNRPCPPGCRPNPGLTPGPAPTPGPYNPPQPGPMPVPPVPTPSPLEPIPAPGPQPTPAQPPQLPAPNNPAPLPLPDQIEPEPAPVEPPPEEEPLPPYTNPNLDAELQDAREQLGAAIEKLQAQEFILQILKMELMDLSKKYKNSLEWKDKYNESHTKLMEARKQYDVLVGDYNSAKAATDKLAKANDELGQANKAAVDIAQKTILTNDNLKISNKTLSNHKNVATGLLGILGLGVLSYVGKCWYRRRGKAKIDKVQDIIGGAATKVGLPGEVIREYTEQVESLLVKLFRERFPEEKATPPPLPGTQAPMLHPDYRQPPPPIESMPVAYVMAHCDPKQGLGPVPPEFPGRLYSAQAVLNAVEEVAKRHPEDSRFSVVPQLVQQILTEPKRE